MTDLTIPVWGWVVMVLGLAGFAALVGISIHRNHGVKRSLFASPYVLWIIVFTILPVLLIAYYAFTDANGAFTLANFQAFWDSNHLMREQMRAIQEELGESDSTAQDEIRKKLK